MNLVKKSALSFAAATALFAANIAHATVINVNFANFAQNTAVTTQVEGVTFSLIGGPYSNGAPVTGAFGDFGLGNSTTSTYPTAEILDLKFTGLASGVSFSFNNYGSSTAGRGATYYSAFGSNGALLETGTVGSGGVFSLSSVGISDLQFNNNTGGYESWLFSLNSLQATVTAVPEPETYAMLLAGLGLVGGIARRRRGAKLV